MRQQEKPGSNEISQQLALLENSQSLIRTIFLGIALQYRALEEERQFLLSGAQAVPSPDVKSIQMAASLIVLCALFGFQKQNEELAAQTLASGVCPDLTESRFNAIMIVIALARIFRLAAPPPQTNLEELALQDEPAL